MLKQVIAAAILSTSLIAGAAAPAFADMGGGEESTFWADRAAKQQAKKEAKKTVKQSAKKQKPLRRTSGNKNGGIISRNPDGSTIEIVNNGDGTRTIIERDARGRLTGQRTAGRVPDHAINHTTGTMSVGVGGGVRVVVGPFSFGFSN